MNALADIEPIENYLVTADGKIHYLDWGGSGPHVHLLHANGFCAGTYSPFVKHLIDDLHVIASDVRGHGGSDQRNAERIRTNGRRCSASHPAGVFSRPGPMNLSKHIWNADCLKKILRRPFLSATLN